LDATIGEKRDNWNSQKVMLPLERLWHEQNRTPVLAISGIIILVIAVVDWWTKPYVSLGFLYLFPIMFAAAFLPRWFVALLGVVCAVLAEVFSSLEPSFVRLTFETLALAGCGLFVGELVRNRRLSLESQARLKALVETSPAAIVTVDERGFIELANRAAVELMVPRGGDLIGDPIAAFLPELHHALRWEEAPQFRASMQCQGHRGNGETFTADVWFSTYKEGPAPKLAAIIADVSEEEPVGAPEIEEHREQTVLNSRETEVLRLLVQGLANKEIAGRMEVSESTIKNTIQQLFAKTGVRTRSQLVRVALEQYRSAL
jgi:PAS domain S-box-containing protein